MAKLVDEIFQSKDQTQTTSQLDSAVEAVRGGIYATAKSIGDQMRMLSARSHALGWSNIMDRYEQVHGADQRQEVESLIAQIETLWQATRDDTTIPDRPAEPEPDPEPPVEEPS